MRLVDALWAAHKLCLGHAGLGAGDETPTSRLAWPKALRIRSDFT